MPGEYTVIKALCETNLYSHSATILPTNWRLNRHSSQLSHVLLISLIFDIKQLIVGGGDDGGGAQCSEYTLVSSMWAIKQRGRHCLSFFFLCLSSPDLSQSLVLILTFDTGSWANTEVEEKTITLSGHKSTGHNSLLIQCVFVNVVNRREKLGKWLSKLAYNYTDIGGSLYEMGGHN